MAPLPLHDVKLQPLKMGTVVFVGAWHFYVPLSHIVAFAETHAQLTDGIPLVYRPYTVGWL